VSVVVRKRYEMSVVRKETTIEIPAAKIYLLCSTTVFVVARVCEEDAVVANAVGSRSTHS